MHPVHRRDGYAWKTNTYASGETFETGAVVTLDTNGKWAEGGTDPASIAGVAMCAVADANPSDTFGNAESVVPVALSDQEFRGTLEGTIALPGDLGAEYGVVKDATGYWTIDRTDTANKRVRITGVDDIVENGDVNAPVTFVFLTANRQVIA